jgi:hypothetical protein
LPDELIKARFLHAAKPFAVHVGAVVGARRRAVDLDAEANGAILGRRQHEVHVAGMESVADAAGAVVEHDGLASDRPHTRQAPPVERQHRRSAIETGRIFVHAADRNEISRLCIADVGFGRVQILQVRGDLRAFGADGDEIAARHCAAGLEQKLLDHPFGLSVAALADDVMAYAAVGVDEIERRPCVVAERAPDGKVVVDDDRIVDAEGGRCPRYVGEIFLDAELGRVHADHDKPAILIFLGPGADVGQRP